MHENELGKVGYCFGCESYHLRMNGLLTVVSEEQLITVQQSLEDMRIDLETNHDVEDVDTGVQIRITKNTYLCLTHPEIINGLELIDVGKYMRNVNELMI